MASQVFMSLRGHLMLLWCSHLIVDIFAGIWPMYKTLSGMNVAQAGLIAGIAGFIGDLFQPFFGYCCDRGWRKGAMVFGLLLSSAAVWVIFAKSASTAFFFLLLFAIGSGAYHPASAGLAGTLSQQRKGRNILIFASGGAFGFAISQLLFFQLFSQFHGYVLFLLIPVALVSWILCRACLYERQANRQLSLRERIQPILRLKRPLLLLYGTQVSVYSLYAAFVFLLPDLMQAKSSHSWLCLGGGHFSFILGAAIFMTPSGHLCDRYDHKKVLLILIFSSALLLYLLLLWPLNALGGVIAILLLLGGVMGSVNPVIVSWAHKLVPESPSTVSALLMGCAWCIGNMGAAWAGLLAKFIDQNPIIMTLGILGFLLVFAFFFVVCTPQPRTEEAL